MSDPSRHRADHPTVREARLYETGEEGVVCNLCERHCKISEDRRGFCRARTNIGGKLYTLSYGDINALESRPIEIKPFFHFYPGSTALTFSTWGCNFPCPWCQNYHLSKRYPGPAKASFISPERMANLAVEDGDNGLCASFTEPTMLFEYCLDLFPIAQDSGLYTCFVSNGYMTPEALRMLRDAGMDAIKIDMKGGADAYRRYCGADVEVVWRNIREARHLGMHVEVVNLIIPGVNDDDKTLQEVITRCREIDPAMPLHFTRYHPAYIFTAPPTDVGTLERAYETARREGILYPYLGNVPGHAYENTSCPSCGNILIRRVGYAITAVHLEDSRCPACGEQIPIVGALPGARSGR